MSLTGDLGGLDGKFCIHHCITQRLKYILINLEKISLMAIILYFVVNYKEFFLHREFLMKLWRIGEMGF